MQNLPSDWEEILASDHQVETKVTIAGVEYPESNIRSLITRAALYSGGTASIGGCVSGEINLVVEPIETIPRMAEIRVYVRLVTRDLWSDEVLSASDWLPKGVYYIDTRETSYDGVLTIHGYDAMLKAEQDFISGTDTGNWPRLADDVIKECASRIGVSIDARTTVNSSYMVDYPADLTVREVLGHIAAANGGNWAITDAGELRLFPLVPGEYVADVGTDAKYMDVSPTFEPFTGVRFWTDDENYVFVGYEIGRVLEATCPWATVEIAQDVLDSVSGYAYQPFEAKAASVDPVAEIGDWVAVGGITSVLASMAITFGASCFADISAPADEEIDHEYPYVSPSTRIVDRKIAQNRSLIEKTAERILLEVESQAGDIANLEVTASEIESRVQSAEGEISILQQNSGMVRVTVVDQEGTLQTTIDADSWEAIRRNLAGETTSGFWFDFDAGQFVFDGTGEFRSKDGLSYITIEGNEIVLYSSSSGTLLDKLRIGFIAGQDPSGSQDVDYPYILLGNTTSSGGSGLIKKFWDGLFIGNSYAKNASGRFSPTADYAGFFVDTLTGTSYVVSGTDMQNVYTGEAIAKFG